MRRRMKLKLLNCVAIVSLVLAPVSPASAFILGGIVYDPTNYAQNVLTAARSLQMINNQVRQLANEAQMIANQAKNLTHLPYSAKAALKSRLAEIETLINTANSIRYDVATVDIAFKTLFPEDYASFTNLEMGVQARTHWIEASRSLHDTMLMQSKITEIIADDTVTLDELVTESQSAIGDLQVAQAGNQLVALQTKQSMQTAQMLSVQYRAEALERARELQSEERSRILRKRFLGDGAAYNPS